MCGLTRYSIKLSQFLRAEIYQNDYDKKGPPLQLLQRSKIYEEQWAKFGSLDEKVEEPSVLLGD
jgi:hypothetical protein